MACRCASGKPFIEMIGFAQMGHSIHSQSEFDTESLGCLHNYCHSVIHFQALQITCRRSCNFTSCVVFLAKLRARLGPRVTMGEVLFAAPRTGRPRDLALKHDAPERLLGHVVRRRYVDIVQKAPQRRPDPQHALSLGCAAALGLARTALQGGMRSALQCSEALGGWGLRTPEKYHAVQAQQPRAPAGLAAPQPPQRDSLGRSTESAAGLLHGQPRFDSSARLKVQARIEANP